uniref:Anti-lipopolysaccharide factor n=1 Tax=Palaemon carinicauda TaxID=392227 RepID=S4TVB5_PALCI|nr:anti-lipopolysaccharide factor [Palaemon carinicauda]AQP25544.1 anti-lipopolysaccharide factor isoform 1 [Palaemon carinicauda]
MRPSTCFFVLAGFILLSCSVFDKAEGQGLTDLLGGLSGESLVDAVASQIVGLWGSGDIEFLDHVCSFQVKPKIKRWQLYFIGTMYCPGWTPIRGTSETRSRTNVVNLATADFVRKAIGEGLITEEQAREWLRHQ